MEELYRHSYRPRDMEIVWDIAEGDFTESGGFSNLADALRGGSYRDLIRDERHRVSPFLSEWWNQLRRHDPIRFDSVSLTLEAAFDHAPDLSGVVYLSHNVVISEAFFDGSKEGGDHPTSREVAPPIKRQLPWTKTLTFSFPRKYDFFGYTNSWGFIRFPRLDDAGNGAGVLISCTTLDPRVMRTLQRTGFAHLAHMYNRAWDGAIHDYLHHVALYTNPSFGIGRRSPMSLAGLNTPIDEWGEHMVDTYNYEYWAHRSHRLITERVLSDTDRQNISKTACDYVGEVYRFHRLCSEGGEPSEKISAMTSYLLAIYLWPTSILLGPGSSHVETIGRAIDHGPFRFSDDALAEVTRILTTGRISEDSAALAASHRACLSGLDGLISFIETAQTPIERAVAGSLTSIGALEWKTRPPHLTWYQWLRLTVDVIGYRGLYEGWYHDRPILYRDERIPAHEATMRFLERFSASLQNFRQLDIGNYTLSGIVP